MEIENGVLRVSQAPSLYRKLSVLAGSSWKYEGIALVKLSFKIILCNLLTVSLQIVDGLFASSLGHSKLVATSLGTSLFNGFWWLLLGMTTALDTYAAQSFGACDFRALTFWTLKCLQTVSLGCLPIMAGLWFSNWILEHIFHQTADDAKEASQFCRLLIPGLWFQAINVVLFKYLQAQNLMDPPIYTLLFTNIVNLFTNYAFVYKLELRYAGSALSTSCARVAGCLMLFFYLLRWHLRDIQKGVTSAHADPHLVVTRYFDSQDKPGHHDQQQDDRNYYQQGQSNGYDDDKLINASTGQSDSNALVKYGSTNSSQQEQSGQLDIGHNSKVMVQTKVQSGANDYKLTQRNTSLNSENNHSGKLTKNEFHSSTRVNKRMVSEWTMIDDTVLRQEEAWLKQQAQGSVSSPTYQGEQYFDSATRAFLGLAVPGAVFMALEAFGIECTVALAASIDHSTMVAYSLFTMLTASIYYVVPYSFSLATCIRVGNHLGAHRPYSAKTASLASIFIGMLCLLALAGLFLCLQVPILDFLVSNTTPPSPVAAADNNNNQGTTSFSSFALFSSHLDVPTPATDNTSHHDTEQIRSVLFQLSLCIAACQVLQGLKGLCEGILRSVAQHRMIAMIHALIYWVIGVPLSLFFAFYANLGIWGIVYAILCALVMGSALFLFAALSLDWEAECLKAQARVIGGIDNEAIEHVKRLRYGTKTKRGKQRKTRFNTSNQHHNYDVDDSDDPESLNQMCYTDNPRPMQGKGRTALAHRRHSSADPSRHSLVGSLLGPQGAALLQLPDDKPIVALQEDHNYSDSDDDNIYLIDASDTSSSEEDHSQISQE